MTDFDPRKDAHDSYFVAIAALRERFLQERTRMIRVTLPFPPSTNGLFTNRRGGRARTPEYDAWRNLAAWEIKSQNVRHVPGEVSISIGIVAPNKRRFDLDNRIKPVLDALVTAGVIADDNNRIVRKVSIEEVASGPECSVIIHQVGVE